MDLFDSDPAHPHRSNNDGDGDWWERLISRSPLWSSEGALAREYVPIVEPRARKHASRFDESVESPNSARVFDTRRGDAPGAEHAGDETASDASSDGVSPDGVSPDGVSTDSVSTDSVSTDNAGGSSWVAVAAVAEAARAVALVPVPEAAEVCLAEAEELLSARDRITSALAARVGRVHRAGEAKSHGHASTKLWLRSAGGMTPAGAGRLVTMSMELVRLQDVRRLFAEGSLPEGIVEAICTATSGLTDDQATTAEGILLELAKSAGAAEVAKAGRYLRAVLDPDGHEKDEQADFDRRFFRVRRRRNGGVEGEFYLPVEAAARLQHWLDVYAKPKAEGDDRTLSVRNADALIALLENKIATELLVLVNAESLPDDPPDTAPTADSPADHTGTDPTNGLADDPADDPADAEASTDHAADRLDDPSGDHPTSDTSVPHGEHLDPGHSPTAPGSEPCAGDAPVGESAHRESDAHPHDGERFESDAPLHGDEHRATDFVDENPATEAPASGRERAAPDRPTAAEPDEPNEPPMQRPPAGRGGTRPGDKPWAGGDAWTGAGADAPPGAEPGDDTWPGADTCPGNDARPGSDAWLGGDARPGSDAWLGGDAWAGAEADAPPGAEHGDDTWLGGGSWPGAETWAGGSAGARSGVGVDSPPGVWLRGLPGLILATGHLLPVSSVHRLARTSTLVRIVMNAAGQVLDMGRKVRLATPAQRRAIFARYATCWVDGCPLPATLCQIDHADDWCSGGLTDLKLLGPACQFHNRDRYRHPARYTRRKVGDDRWAFTYRNPRTTRLRV
ncbi:hypothetical protein GCM10023074_51470 [Microbispora amethystogenes]